MGLLFHFDFRDAQKTSPCFPYAPDYTGSKLHLQVIYFLLSFCYEYLGEKLLSSRILLRLSGRIAQNDQFGDGLITAEP